MTPERANARAILSLCDVVEELCLGLAYGHTPEREWAEMVERTLRLHREEVRDPEGHEEDAHE